MSDSMYVKSEGNYHKIPFAELQYLKAEKRYVRLVTTHKTYIIEYPLYNLEHLLPPDQFCRIHKSYIVSLHHARLVDTKSVTVKEDFLPIGRHYRSTVQAKVLLINSKVKLTRRQITDLFHPGPGS